MLALKKEISNNLTIYRHDVRLIGSQFEISVVGNDPIWAHERINNAIAEINRVEKLLGAFGDDSAINTINRNAGVQPVQVSGEIFRLIARSLKISELTYGAFDLTYYSADKLFVDAEADVATGNIHAIPYAVASVNYKGVTLDAKNNTVFLKEKGMRIAFAAVAKGYAADRARYVMQLEGVSSGVINADGNVLTWGLQPDMEQWTVGSAAGGSKVACLANVEISNMAVSTLLNTDEPVKKAGQGFAVSQIKSVSVLSPSAEFADAMAKPLMAMGINAGLYLVNKLNQISCVIVDDQNRNYTSKDIQIA